jgi:hypothetical protein
MKRLRTPALETAHAFSEHFHTKLYKFDNREENELFLEQEALDTRTT